MSAITWTVVGIAVVLIFWWMLKKKKKGGPIAPKGPTSPPPAEGPEI